MTDDADERPPVADPVWQDDGEDDGFEPWVAGVYDGDAEDDGEEGGGGPPAVVVAPGAPARPEAPLLAIVGRPNVGKSRLFNRLTASRFAIVEDLPGVTRDRQYGEGHWNHHRYQVVDTGGFEPEAEDILLTQMREQADLAIAEADIILFVMDVHAGVLPADLEIADRLRRTRKPVFAVINKVDGPRQEMLLADFWSLGFEDLYPTSAEHGRGYDDLMEALLPLIPRQPDPEVDDDPDIRVAVLGRPNAGKSTLVNRILGEERLLTSDIPGTTRDSVNTWLEQDGRRYLFIDTAGIRRKRSIRERVERYAVVQSFKSIDRAEVILYLIDASEGLTTQDQRICGLAHDKGRSLILVLNKWDAVQKDHRTADAWMRALRESLRFATYAPIVTISAKSGQRVHRLLPLIHEVHAQFQRRVTTSMLNQVLRQALVRNPPRSKGTQHLKVYFGSQVATRPPTFMFVVNDPDLVHFSYQRYLQNVLREEFGFEGVPLKIFFRARKRYEEDDVETT
jgi:GTP-binding protein